MLFVTVHTITVTRNKTRSDEKHKEAHDSPSASLT